MRGPRPYSPEPVDPEEVSPAGPYRALKQFGLVLLCAAWVALGLAGHDPWKTEDAISIGIAAQMADRNDFVVPLLAGEPYLADDPVLAEECQRAQRLTHEINTADPNDHDLRRAHPTMP